MEAVCAPKILSQKPLKMSRSGGLRRGRKKKTSSLKAATNLTTT